MSKDFLKKMQRRLFWSTLHRQVWCFFMLGHNYGPPEAVEVFGPWETEAEAMEMEEAGVGYLLGYNRQCGRCWKVV